MLLTTVSIAYAQVGFEVMMDPTEQKILLNETAVYDLIISHNSPKEEIFEVFSPDVIWDVRISEILKVPPNSRKRFTLFLRPLNVNPGFYGVPLTVRLSGTKLAVKKDLVIELTSSLPPKVAYLPALRGEISIPKEIDSREEIIITVTVHNQNVKSLPDVDVKLRSSVINNDYLTSLEGLEKKTLTYKVRIDPYTPPQEDVLKVSLIVEDIGRTFQFDIPSARYQVGTFRNLEEDVQVQKGFMKTYNTITLTNRGNTLIDETYAIRSPFFKGIFTSSDPKGEKSKGFISWHLRLESEESTQFLVTYNYRPILVILAIAVLLIIIYFVTRSPLVISKKATVVGTREGGISELKIVLQLVNRSSKTLNNVSIIDLVPRIADVIKEEQVTIKPVNVVKHERKGTIVKYKIDKMSSGEQRIITYKIKSKLSILGGVTLPVAVGKFEVSGKHRTTNSNAPLVGFSG